VHVEGKRKGKKEEEGAVEATFELEKGGRRGKKGAISILTPFYPLLCMR